MKSIAIVLTLLILLTGCSKEKDYYGGITQDKVPDLNDSKLENVHEFKGHNDNWGAIMYVAKYKGSEKMFTRTIGIYNGKDPKPKGDFKILVDNIAGSSTTTFKQPPDEGIYMFLTGSPSTPPTSDTIVTLVLQTKEKSEKIELKMD
ncbi:hypothetical protein [Paenibacillus sacheonensis]|uniref:Lipoprotein n=1 Tax=Paenibacillus sacheonensis TaxID=742054 RepID=A0A7X4YL45_9BACL|nr:hypothetical protein [Paenibacillus sacheonensis]MBM7568770.1 hypothetical protein [Paenibacillus sacheonensis]NBC68392.1 hypothetical protein [Paenibacillus sacheonensis]